jgi:5-methylcytosine-specific restriction endonuclease McrA
VQLVSPNHVTSKDSEGGAVGLENGVAAPSVSIGNSDVMPSGFRLRQSVTNVVDVTVSAPPSIPSRRTVLQPISGQKYRVAFTVSAEFKSKLEHAKALVSHRISPADLPVLFERALDALIESTERRRFGSKRSRRIDPSFDSQSPDQITESCADLWVIQSTAEPIGESACEPQRNRRTVTVEKSANRETVQWETESRQPSARSSHKSRYIPANVRRVVWQRDEGQCTFVSEEGRRCASRHFLQMDHVTPFALGGGAFVSNLRLRCAAHNTLHAEYSFGSARIATAVARARIRKSG